MPRKATGAQVSRMLRRADWVRRSLQEAFTDEVVIIDQTGDIVSVNDAWETFARNNGGAGLPSTGRGSNYLEVCRRAADDGVPEAREVLQGIEGILAGTLDAYSLEYRCDAPDEKRWFLLEAYPLSLDFKGAMLSHRDVTVGHTAREALPAYGEDRSMASVPEAFLPALVKNLASALNAPQAFLGELKPFERVARIVLHWDGEDFGVPFDYPLAGTPASEVATGRLCTVESSVMARYPADTLLTSSGSESYMAAPVFDSHGMPIGIIGVMSGDPMQTSLEVELTLRLFASHSAAELERRRSEAFGARQALLIENAHDAIIGTDEHFRITSWNRAASEIYGWRPDEVLGRFAKEVLKTEYTESERDAAIRTVSEAGEFRGEALQRKRDGSLVHVEATTMAIKGPDGQITGYVSVNRDITRRKEAEQQLQEALTIKDQFMSLVSHELRTPITIIFGNASHLRGRHQLDDAGVAGLEDIYGEATKLKGIIENLLILARADQGQQVETEPIAVIPLVRRIADKWPRTADHPLTVELPEGDHIVVANEILVEQVIRNLLTNAEKYTPRGSRVTLTIEQTDGEVVVSVSDSGPGIPADVLRHVFEPFYRSPDKAASVPGVGLGLTISRRLVAAMQGRMWAANNPEGGARFSFSLPLYAGSEDAKSTPGHETTNLSRSRV